MTQKEILDLRNEFIEGDSQILAEIFTQHADYCIQRLVKTKKCKIEDAKDIFVESILSFRQKIIGGKLKEVQNLRAYLWGTCQNMYRKMVEKEIKSKKFKDERLPFASLQDFNIDEEYINKLHKISVNSLEQLSDKCQRILKMFYVMELSMKEIAEELELSSADVAKTTKSRCYKQWIQKANELSTNN